MRTNRHWTFGTFVPTGMGHLPIDFRQYMKYNCFNQLKLEKQNLSPFGEGLVKFYNLRRGWVSSQ